MMNRLHLRMLAEVIHDLQGIFHMAFHTQGQGLQALQEQEGVEGREGGAGIPQQDCPDVRRKSRGTDDIIEADAVIARIRIADPRIFAAGFPVEFAAFHDYTADGCAVAADELGRAVDHDVRTPVQRTDQVGRRESGIHHQRNTVGMGDLRHRFNVHNVAVRVAQGLDEYCLGVVLNGGFKSAFCIRIHKGGRDARGQGQRMLQQIEGAAVDGLGGYDVLAGLCQGLEGIGDGRGTGSHRQGGAAVLQGGDAFFEHALGRVSQPAVDVAGIPQAETVGGMLCVMENIGRRGVDRYRTGVGGRIGLFLTDVKLFCFKGPVSGILNI